jgi:DNA-binding GntR family transcriptional regulator
MTDGNAREALDWAAPLLVRATLHEEVVAVLRNMILDGHLAPGTRIAEPQLCRKLGISRTPLREALKVLASDQLIELLPNRGAVVSQVTIEETAELFEVTEGLESIAGELIAKRISDADIVGLQTLHHDMVDHHDHGRRGEYFARNQQIHRRLVEITRNATLIAAHANYSAKIARARYSANLSQERWDESVREHDEFMAALSVRDGELLGRLLRRHVRRTGEHVLAAMRAANYVSKRADLS